MFLTAAVFIGAVLLLGLLSAGLILLLIDEDREKRVSRGAALPSRLRRRRV